jgi:predicted enzyme related to lactoylglutathione lyase
LTTLLVNLDVDDLEKAIEFYERAIGLRAKRRLFDGTVAEMEGGSSPIFLLAKAVGGSASTSVSLPRDYARHWTPIHLDFVVDDLDRAVSAAEAAGATCEGAIDDHPWGRIATLSDPFGHGFCLVQLLGRGYDESSEGTRP